MAIIPPDLRGEYVMLLDKAHRDDKPFVKFIAARVEEAQKDLIRLLTGTGGHNEPVPL